MQRKSRQYPERGRAIAVIAVTSALVAGTMFMQGCGQEHEASRQVALDTPVEAPAESPVVTPAEAVKPLVAMGHATASGATGEPGSLPPDVQVAVADTVVTPGEPTTIVVRTTSDATRVELKTESGDVIPFVRDAGSPSWRATYRVPLKPVHERWGLSVTARNGSDRWRRVWVFVHAPDTETVESAGPDSSRTLVK